MTLLNTAKAIYSGAATTKAVYLGDKKIWPSAPPALVVGQPFTNIRGSGSWNAAFEVVDTPKGRGGALVNPWSGTDGGAVLLADPVLNTKPPLTWQFWTHNILAGNNWALTNQDWVSTSAAYWLAVEGSVVKLPGTTPGTAANIGGYPSLAANTWYLHTLTVADGTANSWRDVTFKTQTEDGTEVFKHEWRYPINSTSVSPYTRPFEILVWGRGVLTQADKRWVVPAGYIRTP